MGISAYLKEIGRGKEGARALSRAQAADLMGQLLDNQLTDLEIGAFCLAMRIKGETPDEMAGFLDATTCRLTPLDSPHQAPALVIPSYNGSRKMPLLTPLLAMLMARHGFAVLVHGCSTEAQRVSSEQVFAALDWPVTANTATLVPGKVRYLRTYDLCPALQKLLDVRRTVGLRNPAHSMVKMINPLRGPALLVSSYTHPEYAISMSQTLSLVQAHALLLRSTEGEPVADPRRTPAMIAFVHGQAMPMRTLQKGSLTELTPLPQDNDPETTARYIEDVLQGHQPVPPPIAQQVEVLLSLGHQVSDFHRSVLSHEATAPQTQG
ncbi:MAG: DNA-binding protein YbiB [Betaproteobacteria bacterium]|nr:DNA-binding protein YbiB [Betaproteobacteria bacterium]